MPCAAPCSAQRVCAGPLHAGTRTRTPLHAGLLPPRAPAPAQPRPRDVTRCSGSSRGGGGGSGGERKDGAADSKDGGAHGGPDTDASTSYGTPLRELSGRTSRDGEGEDGMLPEDMRPWPKSLPTSLDGLNWWCYTVIGLICIADFTPLGALLLSGGPRAGAYLAGVQWLLFVLPTLNLCRERGWDLRAVLRLRGCSAGWLAAGTAGGAVLWAATAAAISTRAGGADFAALSGAAAAVSAPDSPLGSLLFGELLQRPDDAGQWAVVLTVGALSPAVAEELLFRGFLLTAMRERFGRWDAVAVTAALFAATHLSPPQFFAFCLLGGACGALAAGSGSLLPAVAAHASYNATGIAVGLAVALGSKGSMKAGVG